MRPSLVRGGAPGGVVPRRPLVLGLDPPARAAELPGLRVEPGVRRGGKLFRLLKLEFSFKYSGFHV